MRLSLVTGPTTEPITVAEARKHLRLDSEYGEPAPLALTAALASPAAVGSVDDGAHRYRVTFVTADGQTDGGVISSAVTVANKTVNGKIELTAIPLGGGAVTSRKLYRTAAGGSDYLLLATVADNTTTIYTDNIADSALGAAAPTTNTTEDPELIRAIQAARESVEEASGRVLITQTWRVYFDRFPEVINFPYAPLVSVTSVNYTDTSSVAQVAASSLYTVDTSGARGRMYLAYQQQWPSTRGHVNDVWVDFVAGYGAAADVPAKIRAAILLKVGDMYAHREETLTYGTGATLKFADAFVQGDRLGL
mgnify:CR=1 FL=1